MKTKNSIKKLVVAGMASAMIAAAVGSISGTVAWFQYNTRATAAYSGAAAHCTENLQMRLYSAKKFDNTEEVHKTDWSNELKPTDIATFLTGMGRDANMAANLTPVTSGELALDAVPTTFYKNPQAYQTDYTNWGTANYNDYVELPIQFRVADVDGVTSGTEHVNYLAKKIYLSELVIAAKGAKGDLSNAIRVAIDANTTKATFSKEDHSTTGVDVYGQLDLDPNRTGNDYVYGKNTGDPATFSVDTGNGMFDFGDGDTTSYLNYGDDGKVAKSYPLTKATDASHLRVADITNPNDLSGFKEVGSTVAGTYALADASYFTITVRIYLEGWEKVGATPSAIWDDVTYVGAQFNVGLGFTAESHAVHA